MTFSQRNVAGDFLCRDLGVRVPAARRRLEASVQRLPGRAVRAALRGAGARVSVRLREATVPGMSGAASAMCHAVPWLRVVPRAVPCRV